MKDNQLNANIILKVMKFSTKFYHIKETILFNPKMNTGMYNELSIDKRYRYLNQSLVPGATYYQTIRNLLKNKYNIDTNKKFPFKMFVPEINQEVSINIRIRYFPPSIIILTIELSSISISLIDLVHLISPDNIQNTFYPITDIANWTISLAETQDHRNINPSNNLIYRPVIHIHDVTPLNDFQKHFSEHTSKYINVLIRNQDFDCDQELIDHLLKKNRIHNRKSLNQKLLIDKQGILYITPENYNKKHNTFHTYSHRLYEIANVFRELLMKYHWISTNNNELAYFLLFVIQTWIIKPEIVFFKSVSNRLIWKLLIEEFELKSQFELLYENIDKTTFENKSKYFNQQCLEWWEPEEFQRFIQNNIINKDISNDKNIKVFISYAYEDKDIAIRLSNDLKRSGIDPWIDKERLLAGQNWKNVIFKSINDSHFFITILSQNSISKNGFLRKEIKHAFDLYEEMCESEIFIIPVRIDECEIEDYRLRNLHWVDMNPSWNDGFKMIMKSIENHVKSKI